MYGIPLLMIKIFGRMNRSSYNRLIKRPDFNELEVPVCEICYMSLTDYQLSDKKDKLFCRMRERPKSL
jgi:hypothetical protein